MAEGQSTHGWIDLLLADGPFLSAGALDASTVGERWPARLDAAQRELLQGARADVVVGDVVIELDGDDLRRRVESILTDLLDYRPGKTLDATPGVAATHHIYRAQVRADFVIHAVDDPKDVRMVVMCDPQTVAGGTHRTTNFDGWISTPVQRAALLARHAGADLALLSDGYQYVLVNVVTGTTGSATWTRSGLEDKMAQDAFVALLHKERVLHRQTPTSKLIELSQDRQQELTKTLGRQVRRAAEVLVNAISRANRTTRGELLADVDGPEVYAAATRVLMRTVFLLLAEERGLLPVAENQLYAEEYAVSTLLDRLEQDEYRNRSAMQRRSGAWQRMLALSRALFEGVDHDRLRLAAYGGDLFDPDTHPFLEGRVATRSEGSSAGMHRSLDVGVVDDHTVLTVLRHLQIADGQRISFRSLDVEQVGHVYESLLDHSAVVVLPEDIAVLGLVGRGGDEPEVSIAKLEAWSAEGGDRLVAELVALGVAGDEAGVRTLMSSAVDPDSDVARTISIAVGNDDAIRQRVSKYLPILRTDARGVALVFMPDDVYVTETSSKRDSGTAYTPRSLADEVAKYTLDPLIYEPGPHNQPDNSKWKLRAPADLLGLRICDPAVGSAAILVAAARYLAEALLQSRTEHGELPEGALETAAADEDSLDVRIEARRDVVSTCIYGVDRDPMAIDMAKLSLWLVTMARDRPFTFLDHAIRQGDSLIGITSLTQLRNLRLEPATGAGRAMAVEIGGDGWWDTIEQGISALSSLRRSLRSIPDHSLEATHEKERIHAAAHDVTSDLWSVADAVCAVHYDGAGEPATVLESRLASLGPMVASLASNREKLQTLASHLMNLDNPDLALDRRPFHWPLAFPEVFVGGGGFDAIVGNPPWIGAKRQAQALGERFRRHLVRYVAKSSGQVDLATYFLLRASELGSSIGFLLTRKVIEGDDPKVGLGALLSDGWVIDAAHSVRPWPTAGATMPFVSASLRNGREPAMSILDGEADASPINARLKRGGWLDGPVLSLKKRGTVGLLGVYLNDKGGFLVEKNAALQLLEREPDHAEFVRPYVTSSVVGQNPECEPDEYAIDLSPLDGLSESEARHRVPSLMVLCERAREHRRSLPASKQRVREYWWLPEAKAKDLRAALARHKRDDVPVLAETCRALFPILLPASWSFSKSVFVFPGENSMTLLGAMQSYQHQLWIADRGSKTAGGTPRYGRKTTNETFGYPPQPLPQLASSALRLDSLLKASMQSGHCGLTDAIAMVATGEAEESAEIRSVIAEVDQLMEHYVSSAIGLEPRDLQHCVRPGPTGPRWWPDVDDEETIHRLVLLNLATYANITGSDLETVRVAAVSGRLK